MFENIKSDLAVRKKRRGIRRFIATVTKAGEQELAELLAATMLARAYIEELPANQQASPDEFYSGAVENAESLAALGFEAQLEGLQKSLMTSGSPNLEAVATGVSVWLFSWYALTEASLRVDGENMWSALEPGLALARKLLRPIAATVKRDAEQLFFVPSALLPGYEAMSHASVVVGAEVEDIGVSRKVDGN